MKSKKKYSVLLFCTALPVLTAILFNNSLQIPGNAASPVTAPAFKPLPVHQLLPEVQSTSGVVTAPEPKGCVFRTVFGEEPADSAFIYKTPEKSRAAIRKGMKWLAEAQHENGGWGAGSHSNQSLMDPKAVQTDPATTSMVAMALMRSGNTFTGGEYTNSLRKALNYILDAVEKAPQSTNNITTLTNTQIQSKLGVNIDVILSSQFLTNSLPLLEYDPALQTRTRSAINECVRRIQNAQATNGSSSGAGWAGVLQSSLATNAVESAVAAGIKADTVKLEQAKDYQISNTDAKTGTVKTEAGAGIMLYSVSGSSRASAQEAGEVELEMAKAKKAGKLPAKAEVTVENLKKIGYDESKALKAATSYNVNRSASGIARQDKVMSGFGNNGGEEFISYLQTGESMIIGRDSNWKDWYDNISGRLISIQNPNGTWNGHHCITSPVFCTATCLLVLSVNNDITKLMELGKR